MPVDYFGGDVAARYDDDEGGMFAPSSIEPVVRFLAERAGDGPVLEFGIGTGRIALPLSEHVAVHGIDLSADMLARLHAKPGAERIPTVTGDFATTRVPGEFSLAYLVFNTVNNLTTQDEQVACFRNAAAHLRAGGRFVVEVSVPALRNVPPGQRACVFDMSPEHIGVDEFDTVTQRMVSHHFSPTHGLRSIPFRYVWPAELDLMARLAGMTLEQRHAGWSGEPFTHESTKHVSVWRKD